MIIKRRKILGGIQKIHKFPNGYGASVVRHQGSYGNERGLWELGVIKFISKESEEFNLCYDTHITSDVLGYLTDAEVRRYLYLIKQLGLPTPLEYFIKLWSKIRKILHKIIYEDKK